LAVTLVELLSPGWAGGATASRRLLYVSQNLGERRGEAGTVGEAGERLNLLIRQGKRRKGVDLRVLGFYCPIRFKSCLPDHLKGRIFKGFSLRVRPFDLSTSDFSARPPHF